MPLPPLRAAFDVIVRAKRRAPRYIPCASPTVLIFSASSSRSPSELFLKTHDELDQVERVSVEIVHERGLRLYVNLVDAELLDDDLLEAFVGVSLRQQIPPPGQVRPLPRPPAAAGSGKCHGHPSDLSIG